MARATIIALAFAAFACLGSAQTKLDVEILNFALNLEYLEANFYSCAAYGKILSKSSMIGKGGKKAIGCPANAHKNLTPKGRAYAVSIAIDEIAHVAFLRTALGSAAVKQPRLDIGPALTAAANAASGGAITNFAPYGAQSIGKELSDLFFYHAAFVFEDVGVTAYKGAAKYIQTPAILEAAAGILAVEAYHGGAIRAILIAENAKPEYNDKDGVVLGLKVQDIIGAISALRAKVGGGADAGLFKNVILPGHSKPTPIPVLAVGDSNAVAYSRTPRQVLNIVFLGNLAKGKGGFYPEGVSGKFPNLVKL